jgi:hypothetical protein
VVTGGLVGANPEQLDELAARMNSGADTLEGIRHAIFLSLSRTEWPGPDGDQFRHDWDHRHTRVIATAVTALREAARALRLNADQQRIASGADDIFVDVRSMIRSVMGAVSNWTVDDGPGLLDYANLIASIGVDAADFIRRYYGPIELAFDSAMTILDIYEGFVEGWQDENIGEVTLGVVGIGLGVTGLLVPGVGVGVALFVAGTTISTLSTQFPAVNAAVGGFVRETGEAIQGFWNGASSFIGDAVDGFTGALSDPGAVLEVAGDVVGGLAEAAGGIASGAVEQGKKLLSKVNPFD